MSSANQPNPIDLSHVQTVQPTDYSPAGNNKRVIAFFLDSIFTAVLNSVVFSFIPKTDPMTVFVATILFWNAVAFLYWAFITYKWGGSPGKLILGLRVVSADHASKPSYGQLALRESIGRFLSVLPCFLGYFWVSWDKERRTFHDMIAKTRVIEVKK